MLKLLIEDDEGNQQLVNLEKDEFEITIGRKEGNNIRLAEQNVSRWHAALIKTGDSIFIEDLSKYGTLVNDETIEENEEGERRLRVILGDEIAIGDYHLVLQDEEYEAQLAAKAKEEEAARLAEGPQEIPPRQRGKLVVISSNYAGQEFPITRTEMVIGRTPENDIVIDDRSISRNHAKIRLNSEGFYEIVDLKSSNGVKVDQRQISVFRLSSGNIIELGQVRFRFCEPGENWYFNPEMMSASEVAPPPSSSSNKMMLVGIVVVLLIGVIGAVIIFGGDKGTGTTGEPGAEDGGASSVPVEQASVPELFNNLERQRADAGDDPAKLAEVTQALKEFHSIYQNDPAFPANDVANAAKLLGAKLESMGYVAHAHDAYSVAAAIQTGDPLLPGKLSTLAAEFPLVEQLEAAEQDLAKSTLEACRNALNATDRVITQGQIIDPIAKALRPRLAECIINAYKEEISALAAADKVNEATAELKAFQALDLEGAPSEYVILRAAIADAQKRVDERRAQVNTNPRPRDGGRRDDGGDASTPTPPTRSGCGSASECADAGREALQRREIRAAIELYKQAARKDSQYIAAYASTLERAGFFCEAAKQYDRMGDAGKASRMRAKAESEGSPCD